MKSLTDLSTAISAVVVAVCAAFGTFNLGPAILRALSSSDLKIITPISGAAVPIKSSIAGTSAFMDGKVHVLIKAPDGVDWVQDGFSTLSITGNWTHFARFGESDKGCGQVFLVRAIWSQEEIAAGPLAKLPDGAVLSDPISVTRFCNHQ